MAGIVISIILGGLVSIAWMALFVLLGIWTYRDAQNKGMNGILWTVVVLLVPSLIGLIVYLIVRMDNQKVVCSNCNQSVNGKNKFCSNCGAELKPVVDMTGQVEAFKGSQRKLLIAFFSTLAAVVIMGIMMVAFAIAGTLQIAGGAVKWISQLDTTEWVNTMEDALGDLDILFDEDAVHISVQNDEIIITDNEGNELLHIAGDESVDVNLDKMKELLEEYDIDYDESLDEEEMEEEIRQGIKDAGIEEEIRQEIKDAVRDAVSDITD